MGFFGQFSYAHNTPVQVHLNHEFKTFLNLKPVKSHKEFNELRQCFEKVVNDSRHHFQWNQSVFDILEKTRFWVSYHGTNEERILLEYFFMMYYNNHGDNEAVIAQGKKLFEDQNFYDQPESVFALFALYESYGRLGFHNLQFELIQQINFANKKFNFPVRSKGYSYQYDLALIYNKFGKYDIARDYFLEQLSLFEEEEDSIMMAIVSNDIGLTYHNQSNAKNALSYFEKSLDYIQGLSYTEDCYYSEDYIQHFTNVVKANKASTDFISKVIESPEKFYFDVLRSSKKVQDYNSTLLFYLKLSDYYSRVGQLKTSLRYGDSLLQFERRFGNLKLKQAGILLKAENYAKLGDNDRSMVLYRQSDSLKDFIYQARLYKSFTESAEQFDFLKTEDELEFGKEVLRQEKKLDIFQLIFVGIFSMVLIIIVIAYYRSRKRSKIIEKQKNLLAKSLQEKEIIIKEIHHRIKNNLQVISGIMELQSRKVTSYEAANVFKESRDYLDSILLVHELLYSQDKLAEVKLQVYLEELAGLILNNVKKQVDVNVEVNDTIYMSLPQITPLGLIVCELILNSLKHAFISEGSIDIRIKYENNLYTFDYHDNGIGFEYIEDLKYHKTGLNLIYILAEDLNGKISFPNGLGFNLRLTFYLNET